MKYAKGGFKQIYAIRFELGEDLLLGLQRFCEEQGIGHGVVLSGIGSLRGCTYFSPAELPDKPGLYGYTEPLEQPCPIELISMGGIICTEDDGSISMHIHAAFADDRGNCCGGHLKEGNHVLTTVELVIGELEGIYMSRSRDPERGVMIFEPKQMERI